MATQPKTVKSTPKTKPASKPASKQAPASNTRRETDSMGEMLVPSDALYGATTQRAVLNFPVSFRPVPQAQIEAHVLLKKCCAEANAELGELAKGTALLIVTACDEILRDFAVAAPRSMPHPLMSHFPIDVFQTGSGTSTNMNVNEVVAKCRESSRGQGDRLEGSDSSQRSCELRAEFERHLSFVDANRRRAADFAASCACAGAFDESA